MMVRTQISLDPERHARARAADLGISLAAYLRHRVDRDVARPSRLVDRSVVFAPGEALAASRTEAPPDS